MRLNYVQRNFRRDFSKNFAMPKHLNSPINLALCLLIGINKMTGQHFKQYDPLTETLVKRHIWLTEKQAAEFLNVSPSFLAKNRCYAKAEDIIPYAKLSPKCIRYNYYQLQSWLDAQIQAFKSEELS